MIALNWVTAGRIRRAYAEGGREAARIAVADLFRGLRDYPEPGDVIDVNANIQISDGLLDYVLAQVATLSTKPPIIIRTLQEKARKESES